MDLVMAAECDGKDCTQSMHWSPKVKTPNCDMKAVIDKAANTIAITWDTSAPSIYDNMTDAQLFDLNMAGGGWAAQLDLKRPVAN